MGEHISRDTELYVDKTGSGTYTKVGQIMSISHAGRSSNVIEFKDLDSTSLRKRPGLPNPGNLTLELNYDPEDVNHLFLEAQADAPTPDLDWRIRFGQTDPAQLREFVGFVTGFDSGGGENEDPLPATVTIEITGAITPDTETP